MWIEQRGQQHRVYYRTGQQTGPKKAYEPFASREQAEAFRALARASSLTGAIAYVRDPSDDALRRLLGRDQHVTSQPSIAEAALAGGTTGSSSASMDRFAPVVDVPFDRLWKMFLDQQRQLEETTTDLFEAYGTNHLLPFFGGVDIGLIQRTPPLRQSDTISGAVYVDDWVKLMLTKQKMDNKGRPRPKTVLSVKFIANVLNVLAQAFDLAVKQRPALLQINPAREIALPKQDRREMHFLQDGNAYLALRMAMNEHFRPLLDFLVGTGARFGEAAGLLVRNVNLDADRPSVDIRQVLKWSRKQWKLGRPKTRSSIRRIALPPKLVTVLRPLLAGKADDDHVFTMVEGRPLHHGNFRSRCFRPAVIAAGKPVPRGLRIHDIRHTHAAWLLSAWVPEYIVQRRLGHSSSVTTKDVYGHLTPEADDRTLALVDTLLPDLVCRDDEGAEVLQLTKFEAALPEFDVDDEDDLAA